MYWRVTFDWHCMLWRVAGKRGQWPQYFYTIADAWTCADRWNGTVAERKREAA